MAVVPSLCSFFEVQIWKKDLTVLYSNYANRRRVSFVSGFIIGSVWGSTHEVCVSPIWPSPAGVKNLSGRRHLVKRYTDSLLFPLQKMRGFFPTETKLSGDRWWIRSFPAYSIDDCFDELTAVDLMPLLIDSTEEQCFRYRLVLDRCVWRGTCGLLTSCIMHIQPDQYNWQQEVDQ